jgi:transcriptional regulator with XRE-family HTH domain
MVTKQLRAAMKESGLSLNELGRRSGVAVANVSRFMAGSGLRGDSIDKLCGVLGLELAPAKVKREAVRKTK